MSQSTDQQYGTSTSLCDYVLIHQLEQVKPVHLVDFGAGCGKNGRIARQILPDNVTITAVEGCEKTATMLSSEGTYNEVCHALIQDWVANNEKTYDLAIFGDVLEHLNAGDIHAVIRACLGTFAQIIIICPLYDIFQEDLHGNPLEVHQTYVTPGFFDRYNCVEKHIVHDGYWTIMNIRIASQGNKTKLQKVSWLLFGTAMFVLQPLGLARPLVNVLKRHAMRFKWLLRGQ